MAASPGLTHQAAHEVGGELACQVPLRASDSWDYSIQTATNVRHDAIAETTQSRTSVPQPEIATAIGKFRSNGSYWHSTLSAPPIFEKSSAETKYLKPALRMLHHHSEFAGDITTCNQLNQLRIPFAAGECPKETLDNPQTLICRRISRRAARSPTFPRDATPYRSVDVL